MTATNLRNALSTFLGLGDFETSEFPREHVRAEQRLFDACVDAGMPLDHVNLVAWAETHIHFLDNPVRITGLWAGSGYARNYAGSSLGAA